MNFVVVGAGHIPPAVLTAWLQHEGMRSTPQSFVEYIIVAIAAVILAWTLVKATQWTIRPGEHNADHIKRTILDDEFAEPPAGRHGAEPRTGPDAAEKPREAPAAKR